MNHSLVRLPIRSIAILLLLPFYKLSYAQDENVPVEPSEKWLNSQHKPVELMDAIGLEEGMTIADIGAGRGRMTVFFASRVANSFTPSPQ